MENKLSDNIKEEKAMTKANEAKLVKMLESGEVDYALMDELWFNSSPCNRVNEIFSKSWYGTNAMYIPAIVYKGEVYLFTLKHHFPEESLSEDYISNVNDVFIEDTDIYYMQFRILSDDVLRVQFRRYLMKNHSYHEKSLTDQKLHVIYSAVSSCGSPVSKSNLIYGGKGEGLRWLKEIGVMVPTFEIIPINIYTIYETIKKCNVDDICGSVLEGYIEDAISKLKALNIQKISIRSGAEKSLPGLMDTILDVDIDDNDKVKECIYKVWESYNKVPKELKQGTTGTAVILQEMRYGEKAGVVFPHFTKTGKLSFIFRYASCGEDVVSGKTDDVGEEIYSEKKGDVLTYRMFENVLKLWCFKNTGANPPEYEVVISNGKVYFLQIRDYKLADSEIVGFAKYLKKHKITSFISKTVSTIKPKGNVFIPGKGGLYGIGRVILPDMVEKCDEDYIVVVDSGVSLDNSKYVKDGQCKGVIWRVGSPHAHLGVLCRNHGIAYAKIDDERLEEMIGKKALLFEGSIYDSLEYEETTKTIMVSNSKFKFGKIGLSKVMDFDDLMNTESAVHDILEYKTFLKTDFNGKPPYKYIRRMVYWATAACLGELRHWRTCSHLLKEDMEPICKLLGQNYLVYKNKVGRNYVYKHIKYLPLDKFIKLADMLISYFIDWKWSGGYGGKKWGDIAKGLKDLLIAIKQKDIIALVDALNYLEHCEHNNGTFYNKFVNVGPIMNILNSFNEIDTYEKWMEFVSTKMSGYQHNTEDTNINKAKKDTMKELIETVKEMFLPNLEPVIA